jgi:hypothetical protein
VLAASRRTRKIEVLQQELLMARAIGGVVAGIVIAFVVVLAIEMIGIQIFPQPAGMNPLDAESVRLHLSEISTGSFVAVLVAWTAAAFLGPVVARRITGDGPRWPALTVAALFTAICAYNLATVPMPVWMLPAAVVLVVLASWLGLRRQVLVRT